MFLKEITLTNFKCHEHLWLSFECNNKEHPIRKTTFMLGENGTGKSALLKAIALITSGSNGLSDILGKPDEWIQNKKPFCEISAIIVTAKDEERSIKLRINRGHDLREIISENIETLEQIDNALKKADRNYFVVGYGASRRLSRKDDSLSSQHSRFSSPRTANIQTLFNPDASLVSLSNWAVELDYINGPSGIETVKEALNQFMVDNVRFEKIDKATKTLIFSTPDGEVPMEQLSDGYQNVTAWIGDLMYNVTNTFRDYKNPLKARGILMIDEIDLHLHPKWQRLLHRFLQEKLPNFQVIATTHSPLTAQQAAEGELYALKRTGKKIELIAFNGDPSKMLVHQLLMSPIFGLQTDESVKVEQAKNNIRNISSKKVKTKADQENIKAYKADLEGTGINVRSNSLLSEDDVNLLKKINIELTK